MSPSSFKKSSEPPPPRYRTPSPPRFAFEPLSPVITNTEALPPPPSESNFQVGIKRSLDAEPRCIEETRNLERNTQGAMETFASIALTTGRPSAAEGDLVTACPPSEQTKSEDSQSIERPSKRARSERAHSSEWTRSGVTTDTRPATSYGDLSDSRAFEVELLLNLSHESRFSKTWGTNLQSRNYVVSTKNEGLRPPPNESMYHPGPISGYSQNKIMPISTTGENLLWGEESTSGAESIVSPDSSIVNQQKSPTDTGASRPPGETRARGIINRVYMLEDQDSKSKHDISSPKCQSDHDILEYARTVPYSPVTPSVEVEADTVAHPVTVLNVDVDSEENNSQLQSNVGKDENKSEEFESATSPVENLQQSHANESEQDTQIRGEPGPTQSNSYDTIPTNSSVGPTTVSATCSACHFTRNSPHFDSEISSTSWISCDGCKSWFHFACAGFKSEREVRSVDKYRCRNCKPLYGSTTYVRKSSRAHSAIDYAGLNEGVLKTSDERPEHHYIKPIKEGVITFLPETFVRMRPELVTAEYFEKGGGMKEPVIIPAHFNPQPTAPVDGTFMNVHQTGHYNTVSLEDNALNEESLPPDTEFQNVPDHGQDALDMVMPRNLTVRMVANLYGPEEKVEVIDVKSQNGEGKKWNMKRWADYYESSSDKVVRNVISLEVSHSKLGRLIRRPQIVRDLDLQDSVWPQELLARGEFPRVQLYCLMSVADCFTDFHIDFGGSSVFYHILKGKKTFLFIPPKEKHLKKYEEWCMSPAQNWTFLADQTKECYRVDLKEGDTMLIPAGWIHAVWTPEESLVIGGNFLTRMHYSMQIRIAQIEKTTGVARKFRYPQFQKLHWYTALRYLEDDPLPESLKVIFREGGKFHREQPAHYSFDEWGENSKSGLENYHARYYAQSELEGLPDLTRYLLRAALIDLGTITEGITVETRNAVKRSIPRGYGEPLDIVKDFAMWCAWKRGNEPIPSWAFPHAVPEGGASDFVGKLSTAPLKRPDFEAVLQVPRRQSARRRSQQQPLSTATNIDFSEGVSGLPDGDDQKLEISTAAVRSATPTASSMSRIITTDSVKQGPTGESPSSSSKRPKKPSKTGVVSHRKPACDSCRKRRRACKHRDQEAAPTLDHRILEPADNTKPGVLSLNAEGLPDTPSLSIESVQTNDGEFSISTHGQQESLQYSNKSLKTYSAVSGLNKNREQNITPSPIHPMPTQTRDTGSSDGLKSPTSRQQIVNKDGNIQSPLPKEIDTILGNSLHSKGRTKACNDCRKSKRRCIHDEYGNEDPAKAREAAVPRLAGISKRRKHENEAQSTSSSKKPKLDTSESPFTSPHSVGQSKIKEQRTTAMAAIPRQTRSSEDSLSGSANMSVSVPVSLQPHIEGIVHVQPEANDVVEMESLKLVTTHPLKAPKLDVFSQNMRQSPKGAEDKTSLATTAQHPKTNRQTEINSPEAPNLEQVQNFEQPAASSLVSPPASSHDEAEESLPPSHNALTPCPSSSRHSSRHSKKVQRYTPESGPARRASSSSTGDAIICKSAPAISTTVLVEPNPNLEPQPSPSTRSTKISTRPDAVADEESLKLIKELQAQEHGLRRRGRVF